MRRRLVSAIADADPRDRAARLGAFLCVAYSLVTLGTVWLLPAGSARLPLICFAVAGLLCAPLVPLLPWRSWPARATLALPLCALGSLAAVGPMTEGLTVFYTAFIVVVFIFVGLNQPPGTATALAPLGVVSWISMSGGLQAGLLVRLLISISLWILLGEVLSLGRDRQRRTATNLTRLLDATRLLAAAADEQAVVDLAANVTGDVLRADSVDVLLTDATGGRLVNRGGYRAGAAAGAVTLDARPEGPWARALNAPEPIRVHEHPDGAALLAPFTADAGLLLPLHDQVGVVGAVIATWRTGHGERDEAAVQTARLLADETGRALARVRATRVLVEAADTDLLTGLLNRRGVSARLRSLQPGDAVVLIDLDHFKQVNDTWGHAAGDETLVSFARTLQQLARSEDVAARFGGEEFLLLLRGAGAAGAGALLDRLRELWLATRPHTTFSAGATVVGAGESSLDVLDRTDDGLYVAKNAGRNRYHLNEQAVAIGEPSGAVAGEDRAAGPG
jgi:diguanylate cyclase (GGDEF)-like protein